MDLQAYKNYTYSKVLLNWNAESTYIYMMIFFEHHRINALLTRNHSYLFSKQICRVIFQKWAVQVRHQK